MPSVGQCTYNGAQRHIGRIGIHARNELSSAQIFVAGNRDAEATDQFSGQFVGFPGIVAVPDNFPAYLYPEIVISFIIRIQGGYKFGERADMLFEDQFFNRQERICHISHSHALYSVVIEQCAAGLDLPAAVHAAVCDGGHKGKRYEACMHGIHHVGYADLMPQQMFHVGVIKLCEALKVRDILKLSKAGDKRFACGRINPVMKHDFQRFGQIEISGIGKGAELALDAHFHTADDCIVFSRQIHGNALADQGRDRDLIVVHGRHAETFPDHLRTKREEIIRSVAVDAAADRRLSHMDSGGGFQHQIGQLVGIVVPQLVHSSQRNCLRDGVSAERFTVFLIPDLDDGCNLQPELVCKFFRLCFRDPA